jgi:hypothetical protein
MQTLIPTRTRTMIALKTVSICRNRAEWLAAPFIISPHTIIMLQILSRSTSRNYQYVLLRTFLCGSPSTDCR